MIKSRAARWVLAVLAVLLGVLFGYGFLIIDWKGRPFCHRQIDSALQQWMLETGKTNAYPNVGGRSRDSLAIAGEYIKGDLDWADNYNYVPGLRDGDPGNLVLMYINRPTRWNWHGQPPTIFKKKKWLVVPLSELPQSGPDRETGELSERISATEFRNRLQGTLDFLRTNERPGWQTAAAEHGKVLEAIQPTDP